MKTMARGIAGIAAVAGAVVPLAAPAQAWPAKPLRVVLEFAAGDGGDIGMRVVGKPLSESLGQPVIVDNRPGAGGVVAAELVVRSAPDGYTVLGASTNGLVTRPFLVKTPPSFDTVKDLTPITLPWKVRTVVITAANSPIKSYREVLDQAKANPGKVSYGTSGFASQNHLAQEYVNKLASLTMIHVPFKGGMAPTAAAIAGDVQISFSILPQAMPLMKAGKVRILAVVDKRYPGLPDIPAIGEHVPGWEPPPSWFGILGPAKMAAPVVARLQQEFAKAVKAPEVIAFMEKGYYEPVASTQEAFAAEIARDMANMARIAKTTGIQMSE
jgi:tripartite-type tricarboxylate transporter receptor subunit TctC